MTISELQPSIFRRHRLVVLLLVLPLQSSLAQNATTAQPIAAPHEVAACRYEKARDGIPGHWTDWNQYSVHTLDSIPLPLKLVPRDIYGGRSDISGTKTGFYHPEKLQGRWWLIDPNGHAWLSDGIASLEPGTSPHTRDALKNKFSNETTWIDQTQQLLLDNGNNSTGAWTNIDLLRESHLQATHPLAYSINLNIMSAYGTVHGGTHNVPGHKGYPQDTIFVFDPKFETFANDYLKKIDSLRNDPNLLGYFSDNEIPLLLTNLDGFLELPEHDPGRLAAEAWLRDQHATQPTDELRAAFLAFEAARYFQIVSSAIRKHDPHHLYLGCRFYGQQLKVPVMFQAIGKYADVVSINFYAGWQPTSDTMEMWEHESGKPFMITEFYAKAEDSGMPNTTGAGLEVRTQEDRGLFYQNFVLTLLQSHACVGWHWFRYQDNDPSDPHGEASNLDSNKGIVDFTYQPYPALLKRMRPLNLAIYDIADYLDAHPTASR